MKKLVSLLIMISLFISCITYTKGTDGQPGESGKNGKNGEKGEDGKAGKNGISKKVSIFNMNTKNPAMLLDTISKSDLEKKPFNE